MREGAGEPCTLASFTSRKLSLKARLIWSYLVILGTAGLTTSLVGSWIVSSTIMMQARRAVDHDFATVKTVYEQQLQALELSVEFASSGAAIQQYLAGGDRRGALAFLESLRKDAGFDFLSLTGPNGDVLLRTSQLGRAGDNASSISLVGAALAGKRAAATELLSAGQLANEDPGLSARAGFRTQTGEETAGLALMAAAPIDAASGKRLGALYGGVLLTRNFQIVDRVWDLLFRGDRFRDVDRGSVKIFQDDLRISTNVRTASGERAVGTRAPAEVRDAVLQRGEIWRGRAFIVRGWYI